MTIQLLDTTLELTDRLKAMGVPLPSAMKRRDPKEPGRRRKEKTEDAIYRAFLTEFRRQKYELRQVIAQLAPDRKTLFGYDADYYMSYVDGILKSDDFLAKIARLLVAASAAGIDIFQELIPLQIDYTLVNTVAAKWAVEHAAELVDLVEGTTRESISRVISNFVKTPGMTIGDIFRELEPTYGERRALLIANNETTNVYANADKLAGEALKAEYPEVLVIKRWNTNRDAKVCPICRPMNNLVVPIDEMFIHPETGVAYDGPSAHIGCLCWRTTTTRISGEIAADEYGGRKP